MIHLLDSALGKKEQYKYLLSSDKLKHCISIYQNTELAHRIFSVKERAERGTNIPYAERVIYQEALFRSFAIIFPELLLHSPSLSENDLLLCVFLILGFSDPIICALFCVSYNTLKGRRRYLRRKLPTALGDELKQLRQVKYYLHHLPLQAAGCETIYQEKVSGAST